VSAVTATPRVPLAQQIGGATQRVGRPFHDRAGSIAQRVGQCLLHVLAACGTLGDVERALEIIDGTAIAGEVGCRDRRARRRRPPITRLFERGEERRRVWIARSARSADTRARAALTRASAVLDARCASRRARRADATDAASAWEAA